MTGVAGGWTTFVGPIALLLAPVIGWLASRRKTSGRIATSDAATLWREASGLRDSYKADAVQLRALLTTLTASTDEMRASYERTMKQNETEAAALRVELAALRSECRILTEETGRLRATLAKEHES